MMFLPRAVMTQIMQKFKTHFNITLHIIHYPKKGLEPAQIIIYLLSLEFNCFSQ